VINPMAPRPPKRSKRSKADVSFALSQIVSTINKPCAAGTSKTTTGHASSYCPSATVGCNPVSY
jgi:hypothetical protein